MYLSGYRAGLDSYHPIMSALKETLRVEVG